MQGRLSPLIEGRIQAFPWPYWQEELAQAGRLGFHLMEWTLDQDRLYENPLMTPTGQQEIRDLCRAHGVAIPSLTGDCFMQAPFYKAEGSLRRRLLDDLARVVESCAALNINFVVIPLVDNGALESPAQEDALIQGLAEVRGLLSDSGVRVVFESDFPPAALAALMDKFEPRCFGVNYDIGNSAALGFDYREEMAAYGRRILNVHVKDRAFSGGTAPLGTGDADLPGVLGALKALGYSGNYILQTARAADGDHAGALRRYRDMVLNWLKEEEPGEPRT
jgi:hexulose-6-phosphate isomerase